MPSSPQTRRTSIDRGDAAVSEVMGTILLTAVTVILASGFALVVFQQFAGDTDTPTPQASFNVDARPGLSWVNVTLAEGSSFAFADATYRLTISGAAVEPPYFNTAPLATGRFSPGDVLRFNLTSGVVSPGSALTFFAVDKETGDVIGHAAASVPLPSSLPLYMSNAPSGSGIAFSPSSVPADGTTTTTISVNVGSTYGLSLVREVYANLTLVGGPAEYLLNDMGLDGDSVAGDGVYSGQFTVGSSTLASGVAGDSLSVPVGVEDIFGHGSTAGSGAIDVTSAASSLDISDISAQIAAAIANSTSATNILGVGGISRNLPNSTLLDDLVVTNFTFRDLAEVENDVILYRITDMTDTTKTWVAAIYFDDCGLSFAGGPWAAISEVVFTRDNVAGSVSWRPTSPTNCWNVDYDSRINLADLNASVNATGASPRWSFTTTPTDSNPGVWAYANSSIGSINQGIVPYFGDTQPTANPHGSVDDLGIGTAQIEWTRRTSTPTVDFSYTAAGRTVSVNAAASTDAIYGIASYAWNWGDGTTSTGVAATRTYAANATHTVTLTVTNTGGYAASLAQSILHDGNAWLWCGPQSTTAGTSASCANLRNSTDSGAYATLAETDVAGATGNSLLMTFNMTGFAEPGTTHTLNASAVQASGTTEALHLQVYDATAGTWTTRLSWTSGTTWTPGTSYALTADEWNSGAPLFRFADANCSTGTCSGSDSNAATWRVDWVRVVTS